MKKPAAAILFLTLIAICFPASADSQVMGPAGAGSVSPIECPISVPESIVVDCLVLTVPENYAEPEAAKVRLPFIILRSPAADRAPDPLFFTAGGPGYSSLSSVWAYASSPLLAERDVIVFEQRGNRFAEPALVCDDVYIWDEKPGQTPCLDAIRDKGIDLSQYNTGNIVRDIIALRQALGYEHWNLEGGSFSSSLVLLLMEADPEAVRSASLSSVAPPHETAFAHEAEHPLWAIQQMFADCAADTDCAAAFPDLETRFYDLIRELNASPLELELWNSATSDFYVMEMDGALFLDWVVIDKLYHPAYPPFPTATLPLLIDQASRGNMDALASAAQMYWNNTVESSQWAIGLLLAVNCQQALPAAGDSRVASDLAASEKLGGFRRFAAQRAICAAWDLPPLPPAATEAISSEIPTLVLAGSYDGITPPSWSKATAARLPNSTYVEFPGQGHNVLTNNPCAESLRAEFLRDPWAELDLSCGDKEPGPSFTLPEDVFIAPGLAGNGYDLSLGGDLGRPWIETLTLISILGLLLMLLILIVTGLWRLARRRDKEGPADRSALVAFLLSLVIIASLMAVPWLVSQINQEYFDPGLFLYTLGPSRDFGPAVVLAWLAPLAGLLILALAALTVWAWVARRWTLDQRIVTSLLILFSLTFVMLAVRWGLFTMLV